MLDIPELRIYNTIMQELLVYLFFVGIVGSSLLGIGTVAHHKEKENQSADSFLFWLWLKVFSYAMAGGCLLIMMVLVLFAITEYFIVQ